MSNEIKYLQDLHHKLDETITEIRKTDSDEPVDYQLYNLIKNTVDNEDNLRNNYQIGVRFNVIRSQLQSILKEIGASVGYDKKSISDEATQQKKSTLADDETLVYVYLFNSQGNALKTWYKLLTQQALFEHSVNRPIYANKTDIEKMLRAKSNSDSQAYIEIAVKKSDILQAGETSTLRDQHGLPLLRLRQGALKADKIKHFMYKGKLYLVSLANNMISLNADQPSN